jgi:hypothetical protein
MVLTIFDRGTLPDHKRCLSTTVFLLGIERLLVVRSGHPPNPESSLIAQKLTSSKGRHAEAERPER